MDVKAELNSLKNEIRMLASEVNAMHGKIDDVKEIVETLRELKRSEISPQTNKSLEQHLTEDIVAFVRSEIRLETIDELDGDGEDTRAITQQKTLEFFERAGFVSMAIYSGNCYVYALNPTIVTVNENLWNKLKAQIKATSILWGSEPLKLHIDQYKANTSLLQGKDIYQWTVPAIQA